MPGPDFAHSRAANANREAKARRLASRLRYEGVTADAARALPPAEQRAVERRADIPRAASAETWGLAVGMLAEHPSRLAADRVPGCDCEVNEHGVLYGALIRSTVGLWGGFACRCAPTLPAGVILCGRPGQPVEVTPQLAAVVHDMAEQLRARAATVPAPAAPEPVGDADAVGWWDA